MQFEYTEKRSTMLYTRQKSTHEIHNISTLAALLSKTIKPDENHELRFIGPEITI